MTRTLLLVMVLLALVVFPAAAQDAPEFETADCMFEVPAGLIEGTNLICGYVTVPELHAQPNGPSIRLAVARILSTSADPLPDPLFMAQGGPGGSTIDLFAQFGPVLTDVTDEREIILVEQRGTLYSEPALLCEEEGLAYALDTLGDVLTPEQIGLDGVAVNTACLERLVGEGVNLAAFNSVENAADMVLVADALGIEQFNFYGVSYGTLLGQHLMRDHEDRLRSVILDAVVPTSDNFIPDAIASYQRALTELFITCAADETCSTLYPDLETVFYQVIADLEANPVAVPFAYSASDEPLEVLLDAEDFIGLFRSLLYATEFLPALPNFIYDSAAGDFGWMYGLVELLVIEPYSSLAWGMYYTVICAEDGDFTEADFDVEGVNPRLVASALPSLATIADVCVNLNIPALDTYVDDPVVSDVPTLLTSGQFDPITPRRYADIAAETLSVSYNYEFPGVGHGALLGGVCPRNIMIAFIDNPTTEPDTSCIDDLRPVFNEYITEPTGRVEFARPIVWDDVSTDEYARYENPENNSSISVIAVATDDTDAAVSEALKLAVSPTYNGIPLQSSDFDLGIRVMLQNIYLSPQGYVITLAATEGDTTAVVVAIASADALLTVDPVLTPILISLGFAD